MGKNTKIAWTDRTWNPWYGCKKVSAGCRSCYMFRDMERYGKNPNIVQRSKSTFRAPLRWREPERVFTCSWSDFFIVEADAWRTEAWEIIRRTPHLTYQILTKRPENIAARLPFDWGTGYPNVWLGVTTENQEAADVRIPILLGIPAAIRFLSIEPLIGEIDLRMTVEFLGVSTAIKDWHPNWVIVGGESGPNFRPMNLDWARSLRNQCLAAHVAFFYKQNSGLQPGTEPLLDGIEWHQSPGSVQ